MDCLLTGFQTTGNGAVPAIRHIAYTRGKKLPDCDEKKNEAGLVVNIGALFELFRLKLLFKCCVIHASPVTGTIGK